MNYLQNHIWCSDSNWGGRYDCRHLVSIHRYTEDKDDWLELINEQAEEFRDLSAVTAFNSMVSKGYVREEHRDMFIMKKVANFEPFVLNWLRANVADRDNPEQPQGWCIGSTRYRAADSHTSQTVFFHRKSDAMAFIKKFSKYKKPTNYCQYFTDVRKKLNLETLKYDKR